MKKGGLGILLELGGKKHKDDEKDDGSATKAAAEAVLEAIREDDVDALTEALKTFVEACDEEY